MNLELNSLNTEINQLDLQITKLIQERKELKDLVQLQNEQELIDLKWTINCTATFEILISGITFYKLIIRGVGIPQVYKPTIIKKSLTGYEDYNLIWMPTNGYFITGCPIIFLSFLEEVIFKEINYDETQYKVLNLIHTKSKNTLL